MVALAAGAFGLLTLPLAVPAEAATTVSVSAPQYESPGGTVPTVVTAHGVPTGYSVVITAQGTNGATATCVGEAWVNPVRGTASRECYLQLPNRVGSYAVVPTAILTKPGAETHATTGTASRPVRAEGQASPEPMPLDRIEQIERCHNTTDDVWLTFDDGGSAAQVESILETLSRNDVRGRFFFTGTWAADAPDLLQRIKAEGHLVGNHSRSHVALSQADDAEVDGEIQGGTGPTEAPRLLRPPFAAGALTTRLEALAAARGYALCRWTADTFDWDGPSVEQMVERITYGDHRSPPIEAGGNILMHGTGTNTANGLQQIIDAVRAKGLTLEPLEHGSSDGHAPPASSPAPPAARPAPSRDVPHDGGCG